MKKFLLKDVGTVITGKTPSRDRPDYWGSDLAFITPSDFTDSKYVKPSRFLSAQGSDSMSKVICPQTSVIVTCIGSDMGKVALCKTKFVSNQQINSVVIDQSMASVDYVYYLLKASYRRLRLYAETGGSTMPIINKTTFENLEFEMPCLYKQKKIADILDTLDEKIELNRRMNETLEQIGQALFSHYFIDRVRAGSVETVPLGKKLHPKRGKSLQSKNMIQGEVPVISGGLKPAGLHNESNTTAPVVTISASGANAGFVSVWGRPVWSADSSYIDSTITKYVYTYYSFLKNKQKEIYDMQTGSGQPHIYPKHIELLEIADLPDSEFDNFEQKVRLLFDLIHKNKKQIEALSKIRDSLLPKLISGDIEI